MRHLLAMQMANIKSFFFVAVVIYLVSLTTAEFPGDALYHGVNIHFTSALPGEMHQISQAYQIIRMDFSWATIETKPGVYNFSKYELILHY